MTLSKSLAIACCFLMILPQLSGQDAGNLPDSAQVADIKVVDAEISSADSTGTEPLIPNVFTPNGDGVNDYIEVPGNGVSVYKFSVFTRTGTQVFASSSRRIFWDGRNNAGIELREGVYYYVLKEEEDSGSNQSTGIIYLYR